MNKKRILCRHIRKGEKCPAGKDCEYGHNKRLFDPKTNKYVGRQKAQAAGQEGVGGEDGWGKPVGFHGPQLLCIEEKAGRQAPTPKGLGKGKTKAHGELRRLAELPKAVWTIVPNDMSGTQWFTKVGIGQSVYEIMLDGGSGVNSTTEELVLIILNENRAAGIPLGDKRHPVLQLEHWEKGEELRGVASGKPVPLIGSVVLRVTMLELGKDTGPVIKCRFKICAKGTTDWVGFILGARALDDPKRDGLGHIPLENSHSFVKLGIQMERTEPEAGPRPDGCYVSRLSLVDSDDESELGDAAPGQTTGAMSLDAERSGIPVVYDGEAIALSQGEGAWVPVVLSKDLLKSGMSSQVVLASVGAPVELGWYRTFGTRQVVKEWFVS